MKKWSLELDDWGGCVALIYFVSNHARRCSPVPHAMSVLVVLVLETLCCCASFSLCSSFCSSLLLVGWLRHPCCTLVLSPFNG
jgi:hypothetical protein